MITEKWYRAGKEVFRINNEKYPLSQGQQPDEIRIIAMDKLVDDPDMPRMTEDNYAALIADIEQNGLIKPVLVRPCDCKPGFYHIIIGHNRCRAMLKLNYDCAECIVWDKPASCKGKIPVTESGHQVRLSNEKEQ